MGGVVGTQHCPPCFDLRESGPSGPVITYRLTPEELAALERQWAERRGPDVRRRTQWPPEEILHRMLAEGIDSWVATALGVAFETVVRKRREVNIQGPDRWQMPDLQSRRKEFMARWLPVVEAWRSGRSVAECLALFGQTGSGAPPAEAGEPQAAEQAQSGEAPAATHADQTGAEEAAPTLQVPAEIASEPAPAPQHLCSLCVKADVCPGPEVLSGYRPEVPTLPARLAGAVEVQVRAEVRSCRYYLPAPATSGEAAD